MECHCNIKLFVSTCDHSSKWNYNINRWNGWNGNAEKNNKLKIINLLNIKSGRVICCVACDGVHYVGQRVVSKLSNPGDVWEWARWWRRHIWLTNLWSFDLLIATEMTKGAFQEAYCVSLGLKHRSDPEWKLSLRWQTAKRKNNWKRTSLRCVSSRQLAGWFSEGQFGWKAKQQPNELVISRMNLMQSDLLWFHLGLSDVIQIVLTDDFQNDNFQNDNSMRFSRWK